jgi:histidyl-tRNA synthetase
MKTERCKGMRDLLPKDMERFRLINESFRRSCLNWGYEEVRTPTLEYLHLFTSAGTLTPQMLGRVYSFLDWDGWSGERVVLRPDATIPVARLYIENMAERELAKLFYTTNTFVFEETGKVERERWQMGAELIGMGSPLGDVELIVLALEILNSLDLGEVELKLSHAGLTRGILQTLGLDSEEQHQLFDRLLDGDPSAISQIQAEKPELTPLLEMHGKSSGFVKNLAATMSLTLPELQAKTDDFVFIADALQSLGQKFEIDIASVRGFEYYTGIIFQLFVNGEKLGAGGRYDALISSMSGIQSPASGFALYLEPLMKLLTEVAPASEPARKILVKMDKETTASGFSLADQLRDSGFVVKLHLGGKGPSDMNWLVEVQKKTPTLTLTDLKNRKKREFANSADLLESLKKLT